MKVCGGCKEREVTEKVEFLCNDGKRVTAWFCKPCWDKWRAEHSERLGTFVKVGGGPFS